VSVNGVLHGPTEKGDGLQLTNGTEIAFGDARYKFVTLSKRQISSKSRSDSVANWKAVPSYFAALDTLLCEDADIVQYVVPSRVFTMHQNQMQATPKRPQDNLAGGNNEDADVVPILDCKKSLAISKRLEMIQRDMTGMVQVPFQVSGVTVESLGQVDASRQAYHSKLYILPIGFRSVRMYSSLRDISRKCNYVSEILDGGESPLFRVTCEEAPEAPIIMPTSSGAWCALLKLINDMRPSEHRKFTAVSGPEMFGYANPVIRSIIAELPNADKCTKYTHVLTKAAGGYMTRK